MYPKSPTSPLLGFGFNPSNMLPVASNNTTAVNGTNNYSAFNNRTAVTNGSFFQSRNGTSAPSAAPSAASQFAGGGSTSPNGATPIGHFPIGTFNANSIFGGDETNKTTALHALPLGNGNAQRDSANSPNNLGNKETGIIEKLLVRFP